MDHGTPHSAPRVTDPHLGMNETAGYVIFWAFNSDAHYETFDTLAEANASLASWAKRYPWNTYRLAKVIGEVPATMEREPKHGQISVVGDSASGSGATATCTAALRGDK